MNHRKAKKLHKGFYAEEGFHLKFTLNPPFSDSLKEDELHNEFCWKFLESLEDIGLGFGGGLDYDGGEGIIEYFKSYQKTTNQDKEKVRDILLAFPRVESVYISENIDLWYEDYNKEPNYILISRKEWHENLEEIVKISENMNLYG